MSKCSVGTEKYRSDKYTALGITLKGTHLQSIITTSTNNWTVTSTLRPFLHLFTFGFASGSFSSVLF